MRFPHRWTIVLLIVSLVAINYIDRSALSYALGPLGTELGIDNAGYGVINSAFNIGYLVFAFLVGPLTDRYGCRKILLASMAVWTVATALVPMSGGFAGLPVIRILLGAGEGPSFPAATRLFSRWLPQRERGVALAMIGGVAVSGSLLVGGPLSAWLIGTAGWRSTFYILALLGVAWLVVAGVLLRDTPRQSRRVSAAERAHITAGLLAEERSAHEPAIDWAAILRNRNLWIVGVGYFGWGFIFWCFMYWLPAYLENQYHLGLTTVGLLATVPWAAGIVGAVLGGVLVDTAYARTQRIRGRFVIIGIALLLSGAALIPIVAAPSLTVSIVFISLGVGCGFITGGIWWVAAIDAAPTQPGAAAGFADAAFSLSGIVAPAVMGLLVQRTGAYSIGFVVMAVLALASSALLLFCTTEPRRAAPAGR
ncbi:MFS transporter [Pseudonocardia acaciae]|uniref:MFS transporter n=1 Tax=Pseudonocardia acaciae TaxID=551276 RepID=UPI000491629F|nr:MFS transporter [Pseudonocardia acaciae]